MKIQFEIKNCQECPFFDERRYYTSDFELANDWFCTKMKDKKIAGYVGGNEGRKIPIPIWCPIKVDEK